MHKIDSFVNKYLLFKEVLDKVTLPRLPHTADSNDGH